MKSFLALSPLQKHNPPRLLFFKDRRENFQRSSKNKRTFHCECVHILRSLPFCRTCCLSIKVGMHPARVGACDGFLHEIGDKKMIRMTAIVFVLLGFLMMPVGESYAGQSKSAQTFCKIRPYAAGNEILTGVTATGLSLKLASSAISLKTYWEYHRSYQSYVRNTAIDNKALIRILGMWKPLRFFTKSLIPFMVKHQKLVKLIKQGSKSKTQLGDIMTASKAHDWNALYQRLKKIRLVWFQHT